jgi:hypothetical protein
MALGSTQPLKDQCQDSFSGKRPMRKAENLTANFEELFTQCGNPDVSNPHDFRRPATKCIFAICFQVT